MFGFLETEAAEVAEDTAFAAMVFGKPRLAGVFNHGEVVLAGDGVDGIHVTGHAEDMHRHESARTVGDAAGDRGGVDGQSGGISIGEDREGLAGEDGIVACDERVGRDDDFVPGVHVHDMQTDGERGGATGGGQAAFGAEQPGVIALELGDALVGTTEPSAASVDLEHLGFPGFAPLGPVNPAALVDGRAAEQGGLGSLGGKGHRRLLAGKPTQGE